MSTTQAADSQAVQSTDSSQSGVFSELMSTGNSVMIVAACFVALIASGQDLQQFLQKVLKEGMTLYTEGEVYSKCTNLSEMEEVTDGYIKSGQTTNLDHVMKDSLNTDGNYFEEAVKGCVPYAVEEVGIYEAYTDDPTEQGAIDTFKSSFKQEWDLTAGYEKEAAQSYSVSADGQDAYSSSYYLTQEMEDIGQSMIQMVEQFVQSFTSLDDSILSVGEGMNFNRSN